MLGGVNAWPRMGETCSEGRAGQPEYQGRRLLTCADALTLLSTRKSSGAPLGRAGSATARSSSAASSRKRLSTSRARAACSSNEQHVPQHCMRQSEARIAEAPPPHSTPKQEQPACLTQ